MKKVRYLYSLASATLLIFSACTKQAKEDVIDPNSLTTSTSASAAPSGSNEIMSVFLSMGHSSNGAWGLNSAGTQVASELNYGLTGNNLDRIVNPQIVGSPNNLPFDLLNFSAVEGSTTRLPHWFGGRHNLGVTDDFISGNEALIVNLGSSLIGRMANSAKMNLTGSATTATVQPLLNGNPVGSALTVTLGNARDIVATGGAQFNGLRISAASGNVAIVGTPGRPRQAVWFLLAPSCGTRVARVFMSMGHSSNGVWGHNAANQLVTSERNYGPTGNVIDGVVNPQIYGSPNNMPCDLMNFSAVGGNPHWFGGRHTLGVGDDYISGTESLTVALGAGFGGRLATAAKMNLAGTGTASVQPLLNGNPVGSPLAVSLGNARPINATGGAPFNGLRISAASGTVAIVGTPQRPREAIEFSFAQ